MHKSSEAMPPASRELLKASAALFCDMVMRARMNAPMNDGEVIVEAGRGVWEDFCAALGEEVTAALANTPGWRDISTAPKDGTQIWVYGDGVYDVASWGVGKDHEPDEFGFENDGWDAGWISYHGWFFPGASFGREDQQRDGTQPTHWMPLPEPPEMKV